MVLARRLRPTGARIVFDLLGDIYSLPIAGGTATRADVGTGLGLAAPLLPRRQDARVHERPQRHRERLARRRRREEPARAHDRERLLRAQPLWTPDGQYILARKEDGKRAGIPPVELWMYHREGGGGGIKLTSSDDLSNAGGAAVSPDGRSIYFSARLRKFDYVPNLDDGLWEVRRYDRELARELPRRGRLRRRRAARDLARRQDTDLRVAARRRHVPRRPRSRGGLGADPRARRDARRDGGLRADGPLARLRLHARRQVDRLLEQGQARAARPRLPRARRHPVHGRRRAVRGAPRRLAGEDGHGSRPREDPPLAQPVARRALDRLRGVRPRLAAGDRRRQDRRCAAPPDGGWLRPAAPGVRAVVQRRWALGRLRVLERRGGRPRLASARVCRARRPCA